MRFRRRKPRAPRPIDVLVRDVKALGDVDARADLWAWEIQHDGDKAAQRCLVQIAPEFGYGYVSPMCAAFARYELATGGVNLAAAPTDFQQERRVGDIGVDILQRALQRRAEQMARNDTNRRERQLASLRIEGSERWLPSH